MVMWTQHCYIMFSEEVTSALLRDNFIFPLADPASSCWDKTEVLTGVEHFWLVGNRSAFYSAEACSNFDDQAYENHQAGLLATILNG